MTKWKVSAYQNGWPLHVEYIEVEEEKEVDKLIEKLKKEFKKADVSAREMSVR